MRKILFFLFAAFLFANNLTYTKKKILQTKYGISKMNQKLDFIASKIEQKQSILNKTDNKITLLNQKIAKLNQELNNSKTKLSTYISTKNELEENSTKIQNQIITFISENYFNSTSKTENLADLIDKEITKQILKKYSQKINSLIQKNKNLLSQINSLNSKIKNIKQKQSILLQTKQKLAFLQKKQKKELSELNKEKQQYKRKLKELIKKEENLQNRLAQLKIIKKRKRIEQIKKQSVENTKVNINVKKYGSLYFNQKTANYKGPKTIPPVQGKIIKKFGSYIDPVYKIRIYNDSITIKPYRPNAVVKAVLSGRIVYIGKSNSKGVIVIKHKHDLFTIYANLDKISPILKKGLYVKKGQIIARVEDSLEFEVTYKEKPINPIKVISLK